MKLYFGEAPSLEQPTRQQLVQTMILTVAAIHTSIETLPMSMLKSLVNPPLSPFFIHASLHLFERTRGESQAKSLQLESRFGQAAVRSVAPKKVPLQNRVSSSPLLLLLEQNRIFGALC
jgi:hypothetical protein